jgi:hypothetical protein
VVLPDGQIWNGLRGLRKDNTGYDLKHLFIGAEGTLGIITAAVLKLYPRPKVRETALAAMASVENVLDLFARIRDAAGDTLTGFEMMRASPWSQLPPPPGIADPFDRPHRYYALIEVTSSRPGDPLREVLENELARAAEDGLIADAVVAASLSQADALWKIRESIPEAQKHEGGSIKHDISVPVSRIADFMNRAIPRMEREIPGVRVCAFGHVGDGNIHFNLSQPIGTDKQAFLERWQPINRIVNAIVADLGGSISAEHGIGRLKVNQLREFKPEAELALSADQGRPRRAEHHEPRKLIRHRFRGSVTPVQILPQRICRALGEPGKSNREASCSRETMAVRPLRGRGDWRGGQPPYVLPIVFPGCETRNQHPCNEPRMLTVAPNRFASMSKIIFLFHFVTLWRRGVAKSVAVPATDAA